MRCNTKKPLADETSIRKLPIQQVIQAQKTIPNAIIDKKPSAELAPNQFDQDSLPPYELMDPILELYFENKLSPMEIIEKGHDARLVYEILNKVEHPSNEFKRQQLPPTIIISKNAIGVGRRRPITHKYRRAQTVTGTTQSAN